MPQKEHSTNPGLERLGELVAARRKRLGMTLKQVSQAGGPSDVTLGKIERGALAEPSARTLHRIDTGLRWADGSATHVLSGGKPVELDVAPQKRAKTQKKPATTRAASPRKPTTTDAMTSTNTHIAPADINTLIELVQRFDTVAKKYPTTTASKELDAVNTDLGTCVAQILHTWIRSTLSAIPSSPDTTDISNALVGMIRQPPRP